MLGLVELEEVKALEFLEEGQQQNDLCCPHVLHGRALHIFFYYTRIVEKFPVGGLYT